MSKFSELLAKHTANGWIPIKNYLKPHYQLQFLLFLHLILVQE